MNDHDDEPRDARTIDNRVADRQFYAQHETVRQDAERVQLEQRQVETLASVIDNAHAVQQHPTQTLSQPAPDLNAQLNHYGTIGQLIDGAIVCGVLGAQQLHQMQQQWTQAQEHRIDTLLQTQTADQQLDIENQVHQDVLEHDMHAQQQHEITSIHDIVDQSVRHDTNTVMDRHQSINLNQGLDD